MNYTDYHLVQEVYMKNHEIGTHTLHHVANPGGWASRHGLHGRRSAVLGLGMSACCAELCCGLAWPGVVQTCSRLWA